MPSIEKAEGLGEIAVAVGDELDALGAADFDHASMTKTSLTAVTRMASTPFALMSFSFST